MRPGIVHRIDKDTTGALLVCKNDIAHRDLAEQLKCHSIRRRYRAVVQGNLKEDEGTIEGPIGRHPTDRKKMAINHKNGKDAITHYKVLERFGEARMWNVVLKQVVPTRSVCTWPVSDIRFLGTRCMVHPEIPIIWRDRHFMQ